MRAMPRTAYQLLDGCVRVVGVLLLVAVIASFVTSTPLPERLLSPGGALPFWISALLAALFGLSLVLGPSIHRGYRDVARILAVLLAVACLADGLTYFRHIAAGRVHATLPIPLSLLLGLLLLFWASARPRQRRMSVKGEDALWMKIADQAHP